MGDKKSKKKSGKKGEKKGGGFGKLVAFSFVVVIGGCAALYYLAPDQFQAQLEHVKGLIGG